MRAARHGRRKSGLCMDLGKRVYEIKQYDPELSFAIIAVRLGYSAPRIGQAYREYCNSIIAPAPPVEGVV